VAFNQPINTEGNIMKHVVFTVGRFNPPTRGHQKVCDQVKALAESQGCDYRVFTTKSHDSKKSPLEVNSKLAYLSAMIVGHTFDVTVNPFTACRELAAMGYDSATLVVGEDRGLDLIVQLQRYIGHPDPAHDIGLKTVEGVVVPRDATDFSASSARAFAVEGNFEEFTKHIPQADAVIVEQLYHEVRRNLGIKNE
jgi:prephenate dehydrogenase